MFIVFVVGFICFVFVGCITKERTQIQQTFDYMKLDLVTVRSFKNIQNDWFWHADRFTANQEGEFVHDIKNRIQVYIHAGHQSTTSTDRWFSLSTVYNHILHDHINKYNLISNSQYDMSCVFAFVGGYA